MLVRVMKSRACNGCGKGVVLTGYYGEAKRLKAPTCFCKDCRSKIGRKVSSKPRVMIDETSVFECVDCSELFAKRIGRGPQSHRCSSCQYKRNRKSIENSYRKRFPKTKKECPHCGTLFLPESKGQHKYCGQECKRLATNARNRVGRSEKCRTRFKCNGCDEWFVPKASDRLKFCSRDCAFQNGHKKSTETRDLQSRVNAEVAGIRRLGKPKLNLRKRVVAKMDELARRIRICPDCDRSWRGPKGGTVDVARCVDCQEARAKEARRATKREKGNHRRRSRFYGCDYDRTITSTEVFERDGWKCQSCGFKVKRYKKYNPRQATLDHIIPMSRGGGHVWSNVQTMCQSCNSAKSDNAVGCQLRLARV